MKKGTVVYLINDRKKELYTVVMKQGVSRGPNRQYAPSAIYRVIDNRKRLWDFREDALTVHKSNNHA